MSAASLVVEPVAGALGAELSGVDLTRPLSYETVAADLAHRDVYVCGPEEWADEIGRAAVAAGLPHEHLHIETFAW